MTPRGRREPASFAPGEAKVILEHLVSSGMVKAADIHAAKQAMKAEVSALTSRLNALRELVGGEQAAAPARPARPSRSRRSRSKSRRSRSSAASSRTAAPAAATSPVVAEQAVPATTGSRSRKRRPAKALTPERQKIMQLQGRYLGLMHKVPKNEWARFKAMIPKLGKEEVVKRMEALVNKGRR